MRALRARSRRSPPGSPCTAPEASQSALTQPPSALEARTPLHLKSFLPFLQFFQPGAEPQGPEEVRDGGTIGRLPRFQAVYSFKEVSRASVRLDDARPTPSTSGTAQFTPSYIFSTSLVCGNNGFCSRCRKAMMQKRHNAFRHLFGKLRFILQPAPLKAPIDCYHACVQVMRDRN